MTNATKVQLGQLGKLVEKQVHCASELAEAEILADSIRKRLRIIAEEDIPTLMDEIGLEKVVTIAGLTVTIKEIMTASVTKNRKADCINWLRANELGALVSDDITISFLKGEGKKAKLLFNELQKNGLEPSRTSAVNTASIKAVMKERLEEGLDVPMELFGISVIRQAVIK